MKRKLGLLADCIKNQNPWITLRLMKEVGFETFFTLYYDDASLTNLRKTADELGMEFEFIHSPWKGINEMWTADEDPEIYHEIKKTISQAQKYGVGGVVVHVSSGYHPPKVCDKGLDRFDRLVAFAKDCGVKVAFENLRKKGNVAYLMERYEDEGHVGFCYDSGHAHCYTEKRIPWLDFFGDKIIYTHIHDNFGKTGKEAEDLHLLPFDGIIDYKYIIAKLDEYDYKGSIMIETVDTYTELKGEDLVKEAYKRAVKINNL